LQVVIQDPLELWLKGLEKEQTRDGYRHSIKQLAKASGLSPAQMLAETHANMNVFWVRVKADGTSLKPSTRNIASAALRGFLRAHGEFPPYDRLTHPRKVRRSARITWVPRFIMMVP
jgi:hypothetical protein